MSSDNERIRKSKARKRTIQIVIIFIVLLIVLPLAGYQLGKRGYFLPKGNKPGQLTNAAVTETPEYDVTPAGATAAPTSAVSSDSVTGTVNVSSLNVRSGPGTEFDTVGKLAMGESVDIVDTSRAPWYKVKSGFVEGYVNADFVSINQ